MANRYQFQFNGSLKPRMSQIEGFVSIGTGGLLNNASASGTYLAAVPGSTVAGAPTGWVGGFSGTIGLFGAGVSSVARTGTGLYTVQLQDDWVRLDSCQVLVVATGIDAAVLSHTVGLGNSTATKNQIYLAFASTTTGFGVDIPLSGGFFLDIRVRDSMSGSQ